MIDRIKQGMKVEVSDFFNPYKIWIATVSKLYSITIFIFIYL